MRMFTRVACPLSFTVSVSSPPALTCSGATARSLIFGGPLGCRRPSSSLAAGARRAERSMPRLLEARREGGDGRLGGVEPRRAAAGSRRAAPSCASRAGARRRPARSHHQAARPVREQTDHERDHYPEPDSCAWRQPSVGVGTTAIGNLRILKRRIVERGSDIRRRTTWTRAMTSYVLPLVVRRLRARSRVAGDERHGVPGDRHRARAGRRRRVPRARGQDRDADVPHPRTDGRRLRRVAAARPAAA